MAAQVVTLTENSIDHKINIIKWDWLCTDAGAVTSATTRGYTGEIIRVVLQPDGGGTQPTDQYDVTIVDAYGDVLNGGGANCSNGSTITVTSWHRFSARERAALADASSLTHASAVIPAKALHRMVYRAKAGIQRLQDLLDAACLPVGRDQVRHDGIIESMDGL